MEIEGVRTRTLLDHGAQVTIVRRQLLSHIREKQGWTLEQCLATGVGAGGEALGRTRIVLLRVQVVDTDVFQEVPCYVLDSSKPLWSGEVRDCGIVIGTNALSNLGFNITHPNGTTIIAADASESQDDTAQLPSDTTTVQSHSETLQSQEKPLEEPPKEQATRLI